MPVARLGPVISAEPPAHAAHGVYARSALTHLAEAGVNLPLLMAKSGHENLRSLQKYARPSAGAVAAMTAAHDPARRRR